MTKEHEERVGCSLQPSVVQACPASPQRLLPLTPAARPRMSPHSQVSQPPSCLSSACPRKRGSTYLWLTDGSLEAERETKLKLPSAKTPQAQRFEDFMTFRYLNLGPASPRAKNNSRIPESRPRALTTAHLCPFSAICDGCPRSHPGLHAPDSPTGAACAAHRTEFIL